MLWWWKCIWFNFHLQYCVASSSIQPSWPCFGILEIDDHGKEVSIFGLKPRPTVHQKGSDVDPSYCREICSDLELFLGIFSNFVIYLFEYTPICILRDYKFIRECCQRESVISKLGAQRTPGIGLPIKTSFGTKRRWCSKADGLIWDGNEWLVVIWWKFGEIWKNHWS